MKTRYTYTSAFTIVELLVVIVVIAILATITAISYTGIIQQANAATIKSELSGSSKQLALFKTANDYYPLTNNCSIAESTTNICLKLSSQYKYTYTPNNTTNPTDYTLSTTYSKTIYSVSDGSSIVEASATTSKGWGATTTTITCPTGFIPVPGSTTYGTSDFCVMKYEAKIYGNDDGTHYSSSNLHSSRASGTPYTASVMQINAINQSTKAVDQSGNAIVGAHLITEAEWMTIAQNVLSVASNWSGGAVGSGHIYNGHGNGNGPANGVAASTSDTDGNYGETTYNNNSVYAGSNSIRTLTLTNGQVIWDLAGNVAEWTSGTVTGVQPTTGSTSYSTFLDWSNVTSYGSLIVNPTATGTGISGASAWTYYNGIGNVLTYGSGGGTTTYGLVRGGSWSGNSGVLNLSIETPSDYGNTLGFRVSK